MREDQIKQAIKLIEQLGLPQEQQNERSALTLLALLNLSPNKSWKEAKINRLGITPIMEYIKNIFEKEYAPNSRETIRRFTIHQFIQAGIVILNPDNPKRPINSPKTVYEVNPGILELIKSFETDDWSEKLKIYLSQNETLVDKYSLRREFELIPVKISANDSIKLSSGKHSELIRDIVESFAPRFVPGAEVLYLGDTGTKMGVFQEKRFQKLGLQFDAHGKFPDVVLYYPKKKWLLLLEAVTSHGPINPKRYNELSKLFKTDKAGLVYITTFPDKKTFTKYIAEISWETEVWISDNPDHMIHFNGEKFLGPYP